MNIKQNKGIGSIDAIIAVVILMIFTGIIATISTNIYAQSQFIKRNDQATNYIVDIFEYAQQISYDDISEQELVDYINKKNGKEEAIAEQYSEDNMKNSGYTIFIEVNGFIDEDNKDYSDYIKQIDITVAYKLKGKTKTVNMSTLINK